MADEKQAAGTMTKMSDETRILTPEEILNAVDSEPVPYVVPELKGTVLIKVFSASEGINLAKYVGKGEGGNVRTIVMGLVRPDGSPMFSPAQVEALAKKSLKLVNKLSNRILEVNGLTEESAKTQQEEIKNS